MIPLKLPCWFRLPENPTARAQKHLVELTLVVTALPSHAIQRVQRLATRFHALEARRRALHDAAALGELLHGAEQRLRLRGDVRGRVDVINWLEGQHCHWPTVAGAYLTRAMRMP